jgi:amino acid adenylation domain-containing protein
VSGIDAFLASLRERGVRLWVEGERLKLRAPEGVLEPALTAAISARKSEILALLRPVPADTITPVPVQDSYPVSAAQRRLWVLGQFPAAATAYNIPLHQMLDGPLDLAALETALARAVERHESLRTTFAVIDGEPRQVVHARLAVPLEFRDLSEHDDAAAQVRMLGQRHAGAPFSLATGPLLRVALLRLAPERHVLLLTISHLIADGVSLGVLARDLSQLYVAAREQRPDDLPPLAFGYPAFAAWQDRVLAGAAMAPQRAFWHARFGGELPVLELPTDFARPPLPSFRGGEMSFTLEPALLAAVQEFCSRRNASLFMFLHAMLKTLLFAYTGQAGMTIGCAVAGRDPTALADQVGLYLNTLALRSRLDAEQPFEQFFADIVEETKQAFDHREYPFDRLVDELDIARDPSRSPLFDVMLVLQNQDEPGLGLAGVRARPVFEHPGSAKFDLTFSFKASAFGLVLGIEYSTDLFRAERIHRMGGHVRTLIGSILNDPAQAVGRLNILPREEAQRLDAFGGPTGTSDAPETIVARFGRVAAAAPERIALVRLAETEAGGSACSRSTMSYGELDRSASALAHQLRGLGMGAGRLAAIYLEPSLETVVAILGVLKAGGAYVPLDTRHPADRIEYILGDCAPDVVITVSGLAATLPETAARQVRLDDAADDPAVEGARNFAEPVGQDDLAYVIYTSGSTGRPKGVLVTHRNVARLFSATDDWFHFAPDDVWTLFHSCAFDFSVWELFGALLSGGRLVIPSYWTTRSPAAFYRLLADERVSVLNQTPSAFRQLVEWESEAPSPPPLALRWVIFGGEGLDFASLRPWVARHGAIHPRLVNMYGITETTVHVTWRPIMEADLDERASLIGRAIPDLGISLLDAQMRRVPIGVPGEICVRGAGLAKGYLNQPALTEQRFVPDHTAAAGDARLYRSGDLGRYRDNGDIEYLGRLDRQVQVRGHRVELGEIETALVGHPEIAQAVVDLRADRGLVAWYVPARGGVAAAALRAWLRLSVPEYMMPAWFVPLQRLPLTPNGKLDRAALPDPDDGSEAGVADEPPRTLWEQRLAELWQSVLGLSRVGRHDNFFERGGHSLKAASLVARLSGAFGVRIDLIDVFRQPTLAGLALLAEASGPAAQAADIPPPTAEELELLGRP